MATKLSNEQRGKILYGIADNLRNDIAIAHLAGEAGVEDGLSRILALVDSERAAIAAPDRSDETAQEWERDMARDREMREDYRQADGMMHSQFVSREEW